MLSEENLKTSKLNKNVHGFGLQYNGDIQFVFHKDKTQAFEMLYNIKDENNNV
ncbi:MAG: hypothetical protein ACLSVX_02890 [Massilimicrobiota timonensis]